MEILNISKWKKHSLRRDRTRNSILRIQVVPKFPSNWDKALVRSESFWKHSINPMVKRFGAVGEETKKEKLTEGIETGKNKHKERLLPNPFKTIFPRLRTRAYAQEIQHHSIYSLDSIFYSYSKSTQKIYPQM